MIVITPIVITPIVITPIVITPIALTPLMTALTPVLDAFIVVRNIVGVIGILYGAYLVLWALPELPRYLRMRRM